MATTSHAEEAGFEADVNELTDSNNGPEYALEDRPPTNEQEQNDLAGAQKKGGNSEGRRWLMKKVAYIESVS